MSEAAVISRGTYNGNPASIGSILIIDDEAAIRESLQTLLETGRLRSQKPPTPAKEGLLQVAERPFDLVLLDLALPGRDADGDPLARYPHSRFAPSGHHDHRVRHG